MTVPHWKETDQASAGKLNELADTVQSAIDPSAGQNPPPTIKTLLEIFELTEDITYPDSGDVVFPDDLTSPPDVPYAENSKRIWLKHPANAYITLGSEDETLYFPTITDFTQGDPPEFGDGDRVAAVWNRQSGRWEVIGTSSAGDLIVHFELKLSLPKTAVSVSPDQTTTAYIQNWSGSAWVTDTDVEFEIFDKLGVYRGRAKANGFTAPHDVGSYGTARFVAEADRWEIVSMQPHALMIRGQATALWTGATFTIDGITGGSPTTAVMQPSGAIIVNTDPASNITVSDWLNFDGADNDDVLAVWDEDTRTWKLLQKAC